MWSDALGRRYGGQAKDIKLRWLSHWNQHPAGTKTQSEAELSDSDQTSLSDSDQTSLSDSDQTSLSDSDQTSLSDSDQTSLSDSDQTSLSDSDQGPSQRFHQECVAGRAGVMMRDSGDPVLRSVGEAVMILALGLGKVKVKQNDQGRIDLYERQKQTLQAAGGVHLHNLAMNDAVGWETISRQRGVVKVVPSRFPTFYPPLLIGNSNAMNLSVEAKTRRREAAKAGVKDIARYQGMVSMEATQSLTIVGRSNRGGSYKYLEVSGWGMTFRITSKFLPKLWDLLSDENARVRCHVDFEYLVPMQLKTPERAVWVRENWDTVKFNIVLSDMLLGRSFIEPVKWPELKAYKKSVEVELLELQSNEKVEVEMLSTGYQIWARQMPGEWSEKILHNQIGGPERKTLLRAGAEKS